MDTYRALETWSLLVTECVSERIVSLPIYPELTDDEVAFVAQSVAEALG